MTNYWLRLIKFQKEFPIGSNVLLKHLNNELDIKYWGHFIGCQGIVTGYEGLEDGYYPLILIDFNGTELGFSEDEVEKLER